MLADKPENRANRPDSSGAGETAVEAEPQVEMMAMPTHASVAKPCLSSYDTCRASLRRHNTCNTRSRKLLRCSARQLDPPLGRQGAR